MSDQLPPQPNRKFILVFEDDQFYANIFKVKLTKEGYDVAVAPDGEQGLRLVKERKPDLILLDLVMPVKDGFEVLKELREDNNLKDISVVALSNLGQEGDIQKTKNFGVNDYVVKANMSMQEMVAIVKKYLE